MKHCNIILASILSILFNGCIPFSFVNGKYSGKKSPHVFIFSEDFTFKYEFNGVWHSESFGIWHKKGKVIYLNSFEQRDKFPVEYMKVENNQNKSIVNIKINASDKLEKDFICFPYINGKPVIESPKKGSYSFETDASIDSIYFLIAKRPFILRGSGSKMSYDNVKSETIYPNLSIGENLDVIINVIDYLFGYKVFKNEKVEIGKDKITFQEERKKYNLFLKE